MQQHKIKDGVIKAFLMLKIPFNILNDNAKLEDDLDMDSQELVELACAIETRLEIKLPGGFVQKDLNIGQLINKVNNFIQGEKQKMDKSKQQNFKFGFEESLIINAPTNDIYDALHDVSSWSKYLPHIKKIDITYDDGQYQEFYMEVLSENDKVLRVRSIRNCQKDLLSIDFFQPEPPKFLIHHAGSWRFKSIADNSCKVTVSHKWNLNEAQANKLFPAKSGATTEEQIEELLKSHSQTTLNSWKNIFEQTGEKRHVG